MSDWSRPVTSFNQNLNKSTGNSDVPPVNLEGVSSIESRATARQVKNQEMRNKDDDDLGWLRSGPTSTGESAPTRSNYPVDLAKTNRDDHLFQRKQPLATLENTRQITPTTSVSLPTNFTTTFPSETTARPITAKSRAPTQSYKVLRDKPYAKFFQQARFCENLQLALEEEYSVHSSITNTGDGSNTDTVAYTVVLSGSPVEASGAYDALELLFTSLQKKILEKNADMTNFWVGRPEAAQIIQKYADQMGITCFCHASENTGLTVHYFSSTINSLKYVYTTEKIVNEMIHQKCTSSTITVPWGMDEALMNECVQELQKFSLQPPCKDSVLIVGQNDRLSVFGLTDAVKTITNEYEKLKAKLIIREVTLNFEDYQIEFLLCIYRNELTQLEEQNAGLEIVNGIKNRSIKGLKSTLDTIQKQLEQMVAPICQQQVTFDDIRFSSMAADEEKNFVNIASANQCLSKIKLESNERIYTAPIPLLNRDAISFAPSAMSVDIRIGDLAKQSVDMVVVCSTSQYLLNDILEKAGSMIKNDVNEALRLGKIQQTGYDTPGGELLCQRMLFLPWTTQKLDNTTLRQSIRTFFTAAITHALTTQQTSIAFPALGCGELNYDPNLIAEIILDETQRYANVNLKILIVLLPNKEKAYEAFCLKLAELRQRKSSTTPATFSYPHTVIQMTLIGSEENIKACCTAVKHHINAHVLTEECDEFPLHTWDQATINLFYKYSFQQDVIPEINANNEALLLSGPRDKVLLAKTEFYRMKSIQAVEAYVASYARIAVWMYEASPGVVEKYSLKLNALIEEAFTDNVKSVKFKNEKKEECTIRLKDMIEICGEQRRRVIRKDFALPSHWAPQSEGVVRYVLDTNDNDYVKVLAQFHQTMSGKYTWIQIERIQNQRWYTAYKTFRDYSKHKDTEQLLFHGCPGTSADMIIHSCFNRSFAGVNGVLYGVGVYFSKNASYSHDYAQVNPTAGRRCMFLAKVLVGKSTLGNSHMKVPPTGFDSTTDNNHIVVIYHDDQAYAEFLITYA